MVNIPPILQIGNVLLSSDILTEEFCCDLDICHGACCVEGDAGAPVTLDEIAEVEDSLDTVWPMLSASAQAVIDHQGVAYTDRDGDLVTSIVNGKDCVFTTPINPPEGGTFVGCAFESAFRQGRCKFCKPISCALYPIREKTFSDGSVGLNYHRWDICQCGRDKGRRLHLPVYKFLKEPLIRRFGEEWYQELCEVAAQLLAQP
ncbi:MAG: DUF3109 family protein [Prevotella sp.]|nr:DUF3109 family protein [Prevotella sp.]